MFSPKTNLPKLLKKKRESPDPQQEGSNNSPNFENSSAFKSKSMKMLHQHLSMKRVVDQVSMDAITPDNLKIVDQEQEVEVEDFVSDD